MMPDRFVAYRASLTHASTASAPEFPKNDLASPPTGAIAASSSASRTWTS
jgi:hypothetical protein